MVLTGRMKKNTILIIGLGDTREEKWKRFAGKPFVPLEAAQPSLFKYYWWINIGNYQVNVCKFELK